MPPKLGGDLRLTIRLGTDRSGENANGSFSKSDLDPSGLKRLDTITPHANGNQCHSSGQERCGPGRVFGNKDCYSAGTHQQEPQLIGARGAAGVADW